MKKFKIMLPAVCVSAIVPSIGLSLSACGGQTTTHIVQPTQQEKTKEPKADEISATYIIQMNEEVDKSLLSVEVKNDSVKANGDYLKASITDSKDKKCYVEVSWINKPETTQTCTFTLVLTKKDSWTEEVKECSLKYTKEVIHVTGVTLNKSTTSIVEGDSETLTATVAPEDATDKSVKWTSSDENIATVDENGVINAIKPGTSTITVTTNDQEKTATCVVTVVSSIVHVTGVNLNKTSASIAIGESETLTATVLPEDATDKSVTWKSSDTSVATVTNGVVNALKAGTSTITVTTNDQAKTATCLVTVSPTVVHVTGVTLNKSATSIVEGNSETLTANVLPEDATDKSVTWKSSNTSVATVTNGVVNALKPGTSTITVTTNDQAKTANCVVTVTSSVTSVSVSGDHNVDINSSSISFKAYDQSGTKEITSGCTFSIAPSTLGTFTNNTLALSESAKKQGGSATITAKHTESGKTSASFDIEIATFSQLDTTGGDYSLQKGYASDISTSTGYIVIPSRYWDDALTTTDKWVTTSAIPSSGINADGITGIYVGKNINSIGSQVFGPGLTTLVVDSNNTIYESPEGSNCIIKNSASDTIAFGCKGTDLSKVTNVTKIGDSAFYRSGLTSLTIPSTITEISGSAFWGCSSLATVTFANTPTITSIGNQAFANCYSLSSIAIPSSVTTIGTKCFNGCGDTFASATFDGSNKWIQTGDTEIKQLNTTTASDNAKYLKDATGSSNTGYNWGYSGLKTESSAVLSAKVTYDSSFSTNNIAVNDYTESAIKGTTTSISVTTTNNSGATLSGKIVLKSSSNTIGSIDVTYTTSQVRTGDTFTLDATAWGKINPQDTLTLSFEATALYSVSDDGLVTMTAEGKNLTGAVVVPTTVKNTSQEAVTVTGIANSGCSSSKASSITFQTAANITSIGENAFEGCTSLTTFEIPTNVTKVGAQAFKDCGETLATVSFASTTNTWIQTGDTSKTALTISDTSVNATNFKDCTTGTPITNHWGATGIEISTSIEIYSIGGSAQHNISLSTTDAIVCKARNSAGKDITSECTWTIGNSNIGTFDETTGNIGHLKPNAYAYETGGFTTIKATYTTSDTTLEAEFEVSFFNDAKLDTGSLASGIAREKSTSTTGIVAIPQKYHDGTKWVDITTIPDNAFKNEKTTSPYGITSLHIPSSITSIGSGVFYGNNAITKITVDSANTTFKAINNTVVNTTDHKLVLAAKDSTIPTSECTGIAEGVFDGQTINSTTTSTLIVPSNITSIDAGAFKNIKGVGIIDLSGSGVTVIPDNAFDASGITTGSNLNTVKLSASATSIGAEAFKSCQYMASITIPSGVTSIGTNAFSGCAQLTTIDLSAFTTLPSWSGTIFSGLPSTGTVKINGSTTETEWKTLLEGLGLPTGWTYTTE